MDKVLNNGEWKQMENTLKKALENGQNVSMKIDLKYPSNSDVRPSQFNIITNIDGVIKPYQFKQ